VNKSSNKTEPTQPDEANGHPIRLPKADIHMFDSGSTGF